VYISVHTIVYCLGYTIQMTHSLPMHNIYFHAWNDKIVYSHLETIAVDKKLNQKILHLMYIHIHKNGVKNV